MFAASKTASVSGGYQISRSLRFNKDDSAYLNRSAASITNRNIWTWSAWVKRTNLSDFQYNLFGATYDANSYDEFRFNTSDKFRFFIVGGGAVTLDLITTQVFRDTSAWYHIIVAVDTTQATASNRAKIYVNGSQVTAFDTATYPSQNYGPVINFSPQNIGSSPSGFKLNAYMTEINFIDGTALTPSSFGETNAQTGVWQPKAYSGSYGTNGFYLNFSDNSNTTAATLGKDYSGNGNNWTPNNFSVTAGAGNDSLVDSPTSYGTDTGVGGTVRGNYCTWNPLSTGGGVVLSNGNLTFSKTSSTCIGAGTIFVSSGKWYAEYTCTSSVNMVGVIRDTDSPRSMDYVGFSANSYGYYYNGNKFNNNINAGYGSSYTTNDVIGIALDMDAGTIAFYKNGTSQGTAYSGLSGNFTVASGDNVSVSGELNTGQRPFAYTAPSGFKALCTQNLPTPTIGATTATQANKYFNVVLRNGAGSAGGTFSTTVNMANGALLWDKTRNLGGDNLLTDSVRGISKYLVSNSSGAEGTDVNYVTAFGTNSYTVGSSDWPTDRTVVDWMWAANGSGSTNTSGSITSTVSANTTSGFSIVTYAGNSIASTIGHGLGVAPSMIIVKNRTTSSPGAWTVYHASLGNTSLMFMNTTDAVYTGVGAWNSTSPTSSVFSVGTGTLSVNNIANNFVAYCFAEVAGYSKFGSYTGNGSTNFIYTGFRPAYVLIRRTNVAAGWGILDSARNSFNSANKSINANVSDAEGVGTAGSQYVDLLSNGFKCLDSSAGFNASGDNYIYMAFAENPFKYSLAR
jgi:hypothetical protein